MSGTTRYAGICADRERRTLAWKGTATLKPMGEGAIRPTVVATETFAELAQLTPMPVASERGGQAAGPSRRHRVFECLEARVASLVIVVVLHVLMIAALTMEPARETRTPSPTPVQAQLIEEAPAVDPPPPLPEIMIEQPHVELPPLALVITELPEASAITVAPAAAASSAPTTPITLPRFDADYLSNPAPTYPAASRRLREEGLVLLRVRVTADGTAAQVLLERTSGSARLDEAALNAVRRWRFVPARRGSEPVEAWALVPIEFELKR